MKISKTSIANFSKSNFFIPSLVILLVIVGWFFLLTIDFIEEDDSDPVSWSQKEDYVIKETLEGIFVKNEKAGLSFKVPDGWEVEIENTTVGILNKKLNSIDSYGNISPKELREKEICLITVNSAEFQKDSISYVAINSLNGLISSWEKSPDVTGEYKVIKLDGYKALEQEDKNKYYISVKISVGNKLHHFEINTYSENNNQCFQEFDRFLKTILINKS